MENNYLIPANSKKSQLILGFFTPTDLWIFGIGVVCSFTGLLVIPTNEVWVLLLIMLPALIATFLVLPLPYYHNILQFIINIVNFFILNPRKYYWKGWCIHEGNEDGK